MSRALEEQVLAFHRSVRARTYSEATYWLNQYVRLSGNLMQEIRRLREENERMRKEVGEKRADADWMNGNIADLRRCLALYREREMVMGWNQE